MKEYEPFGPEWEKEMMKFSKAQLVEMLKNHMAGKQQTEHSPDCEMVAHGYSDCTCGFDNQ